MRQNTFNVTVDELNLGLVEVLESLHLAQT